MKNYRIKILIIFIFLVTLLFEGKAQKNENVWFDGLTRSYFARDAIGNTDYQDTTSARNSSDGYNLLDLNTHVNPSKNLEVFSQLRIKNKFGSFFGSGTSIDVRQLKVKGVINNRIRFSIGDLFLKQTRFTLYNFNEELFEFENNIYKPFRDIIHYENFYVDNRWRLQGLQTNFSFEFDRHIRTLEFDGFITRPSGSSNIAFNTYSSDLLLAGGTLISKLNKTFNVESHYVNFFEIPTSGTINISIRNPVYLIGFNRRKKRINSISEQSFQTGFSEKYWLHSERANNLRDSISNFSKGMFLEFKNKIQKKDTSLKITFGYRYVDANFRSAGAQTRRINFQTENTPTIYPNYKNDKIPRPISVFDLIADENIYNQEIIGRLMTFNPTYSNVLPFGDATPNRHGIYANTKLNFDVLNGKLNMGFFQEALGQGTPVKRNFSVFKVALKIKVHKLLQWEKEMNIYLSSENESTNRKTANAIAQVSLYSHHLDVVGDFEILPQLFVQGSFKQITAKGNEFSTQRSEYGSITNFTVTNYNLNDHLISFGLLYFIKKNVYANLQHNWWGRTFREDDNSNFNYNRLLLILSVKL